MFSIYLLVSGVWACTPENRAVHALVGLLRCRGQSRSSHFGLDVREGSFQEAGGSEPTPRRVLCTQKHRFRNENMDPGYLGQCTGTSGCKTTTTRQDYTIAD